MTVEGAFLDHPMTMPFMDCLQFLERIHAEHAKSSKPVPQSVISISERRKFQHIATEVLWDKEPSILHMFVDVSTAHELQV